MYLVFLPNNRFLSLPYLRKKFILVKLMRKHVKMQRSYWTSRNKTLKTLLSEKAGFLEHLQKHCGGVSNVNELGSQDCLLMRSFLT
jgi:hypothetical protein